MIAIICPSLRFAEATLMVDYKARMKGAAKGVLPDGREFEILTNERNIRGTQRRYTGYKVLWPDFMLSRPEYMKFQEMLTIAQHFANNFGWKEITL